MTAFALRLTLAPVPASHHDVLHEIGHRLDIYEARLLVENTDLVLFGAFVGLTASERSSGASQSQARSPRPATAMPVGSWSRPPGISR
ncbi:MAG TPA: hypothetical protein VIT65_10325 [Microlunatus sp.]